MPERRCHAALSSEGQAKQSSGIMLRVACHAASRYYTCADLDAQNAEFVLEVQMSQAAIHHVGKVLVLSHNLCALEPE